MECDAGKASELVMVSDDDEVNGAAMNAMQLKIKN